MGEHLGADNFRVKRLTVQKKHGTFASFIRFVEEIIGPLQSFFQATKHDYKRFNYLGEWHSHHSFELVPSGRDHATMVETVTDPKLGAVFVVLLLVKLNRVGALECAVTVYRAGGQPFAGKIVLEQE
jgi:hypothetical protein